MFEPSTKPRVFGAAPGADFPAVLVEQVLSRLASRAPEELARVTILVNTTRMERRLLSLFAEGAPRLLPRIGRVTNVEGLLPGVELPSPVSRLRRKLELSQLTSELIKIEPDLASRRSSMDLADTLASLIDELQSEGIDPDRLRAMDVGDVSAHWERSLKFLDIATDYVRNAASDGLDSEARHRQAVIRLCEHWAANPPTAPIILAGSTGSRSTTRLLMGAVSRLPQGAILLPGFDFDVPEAVWNTFADVGSAEDHPQYRLANLLRELGVERSDVAEWGTAPDPDRNKVVSLSLRPAAVTDQWLTEGPSLGNLKKACDGLSLIEAPDARSEAVAIAVALREAVERRERAAMVTTDRTLSRRVAAVLDRWNIRPDDSAGVPLSLTPPGRFLREVVRMMGRPVEPEALISLLKHPLCRAGGEDRGPHLRLSRKLELYIRKSAIFVITGSAIDGFAEKLGEEAKEWIAWLKHVITKVEITPRQSLESTVQQHIALATLLADGENETAEALWKTSAGETCQSLIQGFSEEFDFAGTLVLSDYAQLFEKALAAESDRDSDLVRPDVMIWGTLEARVQGADLVILAGLNEGVWPEADTPDPWLNRRMRRELGLLVPEGQVGLAAHDYQQAIAAERVILSRSSRVQDGEAVPSRWLNRLTNLLDGLPDQGGKDALEAMRERGRTYLDMAKALDRPIGEIDPETRPAPAPPVEVRPKSLSVTEIKTLIRDPYAIYAKHVLGLRPLMPLTPKLDARLKGIVFHEIFDAFFDPAISMDNIELAREQLLEFTEKALTQHVPRDAIRVHWAGQISLIADALILDEVNRRLSGSRVASEVKGTFEDAASGVQISGTADRIDQNNDGSLSIYDYKTGAVPSDKMIKSFDRQLLIEAVMAEAGVFKDVAARPVSRLSYIHLGRTPKHSEIIMGEDYETVTIQRELSDLLSRFNEATTGYISRRAMEKVRYEGDYDHLARFGEWDASGATKPEPLT